MKIAVAGAGAVGGYFGGKLKQIGHEVTFLARGKHLDAMKKDGLIIIEEAQRLLIDGQFTNEINDLTEADLVLFCVKSNDTKQMAEALIPVLKENSLILTLQNGVENEDILKKIFGEDRVLSAVTYIQAAVETPGIVRQQGRVKLIIGGLSPTTDAYALVSLLQEAGIDSVPSANIMARKWSKLMWNATFNPLSALSEARVGDILEDVHLRKTAETICTEVVSVAYHMGVDLDMEETIGQIFSRAEHAKKHQTSMLQDRLRGKLMEVDAMCGYIVNQGRRIGVPTPALQSIYSTLNFINQQHQSMVRPV